MRFSIFPSATRRVRRVVDVKTFHSSTCFHFWTGIFKTHDSTPASGANVLSVGCKYFLVPGTLASRKNKTKTIALDIIPFPFILKKYDATAPFSTALQADDDDGERRDELSGREFNHAVACVVSSRDDWEKGKTINKVETSAIFFSFRVGGSEILYRNKVSSRKMTDFEPC